MFWTISLGLPSYFQSSTYIFIIIIVTIIMTQCNLTRTPSQMHPTIKYTYRSSSSCICYVVGFMILCFYFIFWVKWREIPLKRYKYATPAPSSHAGLKRENCKKNDAKLKYKLFLSMRSRKIKIIKIQGRLVLNGYFFS